MYIYVFIYIDVDIRRLVDTDGFNFDDINAYTDRGGARFM